MNQVQILSAIFDAACFLLAHMEKYDATKINLDQLRNDLRCIIQDSATAKVLAVEEELGLRESAEKIKK